MPTFEQAKFIEIDVTPEEFLDECSDEEIKELVDLLKSDYPEFLDIDERLERRSIGEREFEDTINALHNKWNMLSTEEEETIKNIAKRFL